MSLGDGLHLEEDNKILASKRGRSTVENTFAPSEKDAMHTHPSVWYYPHQTRKQAGRQKMENPAGSSGRSRKETENNNTATRPWRASAKLASSAGVSTK
jgi:hypothetical protein